MAVPRKRSVAQLKKTILNSAQTSHFEVEIIPNTNVRNWILGLAAGNSNKGSARIVSNDFFDNDLKLSCHQASLPGSSFATHELNNKYHNTTIRNVYRKTFDQTTSFSFYVDKNYDILHFFENWMAFMMQETDDAARDPRSSYRALYPNTYRAFGLSITKFERDYSGRVMVYNFIDAYPSSINTMQLDYSGSQILNVTVGFNFTRYYTSSIDMESNAESLSIRLEENRQAERIQNALDAAALNS